MGMAEAYGWDEFPMADPTQHPGAYEDFLASPPPASTQPFWEDHLTSGKMPAAEEGTLPKYAYPSPSVRNPDPEFTKGMVPNPADSRFQMGKGIINPKFEQPVKSSIGSLPESFTQQDNWGDFPQVA